MPRTPYIRRELARRITREQYDTVFNLYMRREIYKFASRPIDFSRIVKGLLDLSGSETIVDVGCADGQILEDLQSQYNHTGKMIGVDINEALFVGAILHERLKRPIHLVATDAQCLPLPDNSCDRLLAMFMLYHVAQPNLALQEFRRVLKPDGQLLVATSGPKNKEKQRGFEQAIAEELDISPPPPFSKPFNNLVAARRLPRYFQRVSHLEISDTVRINPIQTPEAYAAYMSSLLSMRPSFGGGDDIPPIRAWRQAIATCVEPAINQAVEERGYFEDTFDLHFYTCLNTKAA